MFGFVIAGVSLAGLIFLAARRHRHGGYGAYWAFRRLDTSPGQEKVIRTALSEAREVFRDFRKSNHGAKQELGPILEAEHLDERALESWLGARESSFQELKPRLMDIAKRIHDVLDPEQRRRVARWVTSSHGYHHHYHGHHYGGCHGC
jgi:Spy/CpxP family protein refolding chaperone